MSTTPMSWFACRKFIKQAKKDLERFSSIMLMAKEKHRCIDTGVPVFVQIEQYYEVIKELLIALLLKEGFKSRNHECLIAYLKEYHQELQQEVLVIHELKNTRNDIQYEAFMPPQDYLDRNKSSFERIIVLLELLVRE